jgi:hypothetical protein
MQAARLHSKERTVLCMTQSPDVFNHNSLLYKNVTCTLLFCYIQLEGRANERAGVDGFRV